jgi:hypothetical protein
MKTLLLLAFIVLATAAFDSNRPPAVDRPPVVDRPLGAEFQPIAGSSDPLSVPEPSALWAMGGALVLLAGTGWWLRRP